MEGVGPGSILGGRFTATTRVDQYAGTERWDGFEPELARSVSILCLPVNDPRTPALLDAARVAAGLDNRGCVRILDIGRDNSVAFVVEEALDDAESLAELVRADGLPGDEVRRIAGEVSTTLDAAASRGVHHCQLTPDMVFRTGEGTVKVRGLATAAVIASRDEGGASAARIDALGVIGLTYAGLTGRWPLPALRSSLDPAPDVAGGVVAPSEIASGVPRDLDALCRETLGGRGGPRSPGEVARMIAPWSSRPVVGRPRQLPSTADAGVPVQRATAASPTAAASASTGISAAPPAIAVSPIPASPSSAATPGPSERPAGPQAQEQAIQPPVPGTPAEPLTPQDSRLALGIVAAFVALALLVGINGVRKIGSQTDLALGAGTSAPASTSAKPSDPAAPATGPKSLAVLSADGFDPLGDNSENSQLAPKVFDADPASEWSSEGYQSATFGNLKTGVGVIVDLGPNVSPKVVKLTIPTPVDVTVLVSSNRSLDGAVTAGKLTAATGTVSVDIPADAGARQYVIVWFTNVSRDNDGFFRAHLGEVAVLG